MTTDVTSSGPATTARRGRADLLRALLAGDEAGLGAMADLLGYEAKPPPRPPGETRSDPAPVAPTPSRDAEPTPAVDTRSDPIPFWRLVRRNYRHQEATRLGLVEPGPEPTTEVLRDSDLDPDPEAANPQPRPITPWPQLWRVLDDRLRTTHPRQEIDIPRLVDRWARQLDIERIPRLAGLVHCPTRLLIDLGSRLLPFRHDQFEILVELERRLGPGKIQVVAWRGGVDLGPLAEDEQVLALTDLGAYGDAEDRRAWRALGGHLDRAGMVAHALMPVPTERWPSDLGPWQVIEWSRPSWVRAQSSTDSAASDPVEQALRLAALATRLETGLVRDLVRLVPGATLATEAALWAHPSVVRKTTRGLVLDAEACRRRQGERGELDDRQMRGTLAAFERWHRESLPEVWAEEIGRLLSLGVPETWVGADAVDQAAEIVAKLGRTVELGPEQGGEHAAGAESFVRRLEPRITQWQHPRFGLPLAKAVAAIRERDEETEVEPEPAAGTVPDMLPPLDEAIRHWSLRQVAGGIAVFPGLAGDSLDQGSWLATVEARAGRLWIGDGVVADLEIDLETHTEPIPWSLDRGVLHITTDVEIASLEPWTQPAWASASGRDGYGLWVAFEFRGVEQRMRWIPPGRFLMGSPEDEVGRIDGEGPQHEVVLTEGYWLGETQCIQALWIAAMGENPSRFQSLDRPVEQVSWEDCQHFFDRINFRVRNLELTLPTEAEWEHACRAGTLTATWLGTVELLGFRNAPILDPIAWYAGNSGVDFDLRVGVKSSGWPEKQYEHSRAGTREVGLKAANAWGLRDTLGNVREWCWDFRGSYSSKPELDPQGDSAGSHRVSRGGAWSSGVPDVRAAYRFGRAPDRRGSALGFRLARAPEKLAQVPEGSHAVSKPVQRSVRTPNRRARSWVDRLEWAADGGIDAYGRWAAIEVKGVIHRLRWIYPGRFLMGSPEDEEGRYDWEGPQHEVTLTEGFWLGETPCTQDLWQVVMGSNPSHFQSPDRPVERVNWHDCHEFFGKLRNLAPGFLGQLPTEAQWEYACRAGTTDATWQGNLTIHGEDNAPALNPIAWYGGNCGVGFGLDDGFDTSIWPEKQYPHTRGGTRGVRSKRPNPWGLYDMLGNVFEWCHDSWNWQEPYSGEDRVNPQVEEGSIRVSRGGSWDSGARYARAAFRYGYLPGNLLDYLGFRLSRGPEPRWAEPLENAEPNQKQESTT